MESKDEKDSSNSTYTGRKLEELRDPATIGFYEPNALKELDDGRIIYFTSKGCKIIVMSIDLNGHEDDIMFEIDIGFVESIIQLKNKLVIYGTNYGLIEIISLNKNSYESKQKITNEKNSIQKLVEMTNSSFVSLMGTNDIKLYEKKNEQYENTVTINYKKENISWLTSGIESFIDNQLLVTTPFTFLFVDMQNKKILKEIKAKEDDKIEKEKNEEGERKYKKEDISLFNENCLRYDNTIIVAGIFQLFLIDCTNQSIIKIVKLVDDDYACLTLTRFVSDTFVTGSGFGEMVQYKLNKDGSDLEVISTGALYVDRVRTNVYSRCGRYIIGEYNGLVILSFH